MSDTTNIPYFKSVPYITMSDLLAGSIKVFWKQQTNPSDILTTIGEMVLYKDVGRLIGDHTSLMQLSGDGNNVVRIVSDKQMGKDIEEDLFVGIISQTDNGLRKNKTYKEAFKEGVMDAGISFASRYIMNKVLGGDSDVLSYLQNINPLNPHNAEDA